MTTSFFTELLNRNRVLAIFGLLNFAAGALMLVLMQFDHTELLGINRWIKPFKFFISVAIWSWSMAWYLVYLKKQRAVTIYSWMFIILMTVEQSAIAGQAARGVPSHFNVATAFDGMIFSIMGIVILTVTVWTLCMGILFFLQKEFTIPMSYVWGIRLGILLFSISCFEGGYMAARLSHSVGGADGGPGLPLLNWSTAFGDLRVAHFMGLHALQFLPLFGYWISQKDIVRSVSHTLLFSIAYFITWLLLLTEALNGMPLIASQY
ncbi:MAG: hypothetical protein IPO83_11435 [Chitinophagaceae bacterium]|nr:hypothetical protein [Chitinophagaceae bacterium]